MAASSTDRVPTTDAAHWAAARAAMLLDPTAINLNTGSFGPLPRPVFERATALRQRLAEAPMDFLVRQAPALLWESRTRLAVFLGADPRRLIFSANVSAAVNLVAGGLTLAGPGDILLTDHEYGAMHWCWERAAQRQGLNLRIVHLPILAEDPQKIVDALRAALTERTRLVFFSHVLSPTGLVLPAKELCREAKKRGALTVIDGAHAPAMLPLDLTDLGADFYCGNCHKWLLAPTGSGFLHLGAGQEDRLQPLQVSWGWRPERTKMDEPDEFGSTPRLRFYEFEGTRDVCPWLAVPAAIDFQERLGFDAIRERNQALVAFTRERLECIPGLSRATPRDPRLHGFMTAYRLPRQVHAPTWRKGLWEEFRIEAPLVERPEGLLLRVSTHFYNTEEEIERLAAAVTKLLALAL